ncbi:MAG: DUF6391 domain-containing protein [Chloroflexi bacterium]|nr:DUF6391 domain-containing protein [Chloroflexota bacterium]MDA1003079.1 DUF6391 domain-containing protein [Chloroflexota bacterium]MQC27825.1 hypothetical protein [Chloroflexota bacterium]
MLRGWIDAVRRNHALEHATVAVFLARYGPTRMAGRASGDGFFILGDVPDDALRTSVEEGLRRLQSGEASLAVSPLCGTNIAVSGLLAATAATAVLSSGSTRSRFGNAVTASMLAVIVAQPLGRLIQQHVTTRPDLDHVEFVDIRTLLPGVRKVRTRVTR